MLGDVTEAPGSGRTRTAGAVLAWLAAVGVATLAGMLAVGAIGSGIGSQGGQGGQPLSQAEVSRRLAASGTTTPPSTRPAAPSSVPPASADPQPANKAFPTSGGTVIARCDPGIRVVSATPAQGYGVKDVEPEDGGLRVRFESGRTRVEVRLTCINGEPQASTRVN